MRIEDVFEGRDSSHLFILSTSPTNEHRSAKKTQNGKYDRIIKVPVHRTQFIHKTSNDLTSSSSEEKIRLQTSKLTREQPYNKTDNLFTASANVVSWGKLHKPINEAKNLTSKILSQSGSADFNESIHTDRQSQTVLFDNNTVSRFYWGVNYETPFSISKLNRQSIPSTVSTTSQPISSLHDLFLHTTLPSSVLIRGAMPIKNMKVTKLKRSRVTTNAKNDHEFAERKGLTFDQSPSIIVTKWQGSLQGAKLQVIKTAAAAAAAASLRVGRKAGMESHLMTNTERELSSVEEKVNRSRLNNGRATKPFPLNKTLPKNSQLDKETVKWKQLAEDAGNRSRSNKELNASQLIDTKLKNKSNDDYTLVIPSTDHSDKLEVVTDSRIKHKLSSGSRLQAKEKQFENNYNDRMIISNGFTNKLLASNETILTQLPIDSPLSHVENLLNLPFEDTVIGRLVKPQKSIKMETSLNNNNTETITSKNDHSNTKANVKRRSTGEPDLKISTELNENGSGDVDIIFDQVSNIDTQFSYSSVGPKSTLVAERTSTSLEKELADSRFKSISFPAQTFSYNFPRESASLTGDHPTTAEPFTSRTEFFQVSSHSSPSTSVNRPLLPQDSVADIDMELPPRTESKMNVGTPSFADILSEIHGPVFKQEHHDKKKHLLNSGRKVYQASTANFLNPLDSGRHPASHLHSRVKLSTGIRNSKSGDHNWKRTKIHEAALNGSRTTGYDVINKRLILSVASTTEKTNKITYVKEKKQLRQRAKELSANGNSVVLNKKSFKKNGGGIKEIRPSEFPESNSTTNRYSPRHVAEKDGNKISRIIDGEDQDSVSRIRNTQTTVGLKISGNVGINKTDFLQDQRDFSAVSSVGVKKITLDGVFRKESSDYSNNKNKKIEWLSSRQIVRPTISYESKRIARKSNTVAVTEKRKTFSIPPGLRFTTVTHETGVSISSALNDRNNMSGITEEKPLKATIPNNIASILFSMSGLDDNIVTKNLQRQTYAFSSETAITTEKNAVTESNMTGKKDNKSNVLLNRRQSALTSKQYDKKDLKEREYDSGKGKSWSGDFSEGTQIAPTLALTSYYENRSTAEKDDSTIPSPISTDTRFINKKEFDKHKNNDLTITNSSLTQRSTVKSLMFTEKLSQNPRHEMNSILGDGNEKTAVIPTKEISILESKSRVYAPKQSMPTSNPSFTEKSGEKALTELPRRQNLDKNEDLRGKDKIKVAVTETKTTFAHASMKTTMTNIKNISRTTEETGLQNTLLGSIIGSLPTNELEPKISKSSLEYSPITHSDNNDFNYNKGIRPKVSAIIDGRYTKISQKELEKEGRIDQDLQFENYYENRLNGRISLASRFPDAHSRFLGFTTADVNASPVFSSTQVANSVSGIKEKVGTIEPTFSLKHSELEPSYQSDKLSSNLYKTTKLYQNLIRDKVVLTTPRWKRSSNDEVDRKEVAITITESSKTIKKKLFDRLLTKWTTDVSGTRQTTHYKDVLKTLKKSRVLPVSNTIAIRNQVTLSSPLSKEIQNSFSSTIKTKSSESISAKGSHSAPDKNKLILDKRNKFSKDSNRNKQTLSSFLQSSTKGLKVKFPTSTRNYLKRTLPKWIIFPQNFEDFLRLANRKPYTEPSQQSIPTTKLSPSSKGNEMRPKATASGKILFTRPTTPVYFIPRWPTVYLREKRLYRPSTASLSHHPSKWTTQMQTSKNPTEEIGWATVNNTLNVINTNLVQDYPIKEDWSFQSIRGIRDAFEKYWPAISGSTFGVLFLCTAILTSVMFRKR